jgi:hypothetical protein
VAWAFAGAEAERATSETPANKSISYPPDQRRSFQVNVIEIGRRPLIGMCNSA